MTRIEKETQLHLLHKMQSAQQYWIPKNVTVTIELLTISVEHCNIGCFFVFFFCFLNKIYSEDKVAAALPVNITCIYL